jgi:Tfp pilus assembly protein PilO
MKNLPKEKRDRLILLVMGTLVVVVGLYYGLITMQQKSLQETAKKKIEHETKLGNGQRIVGNSAKVQEALDAGLAKVKAIESTMPSGDIYSWIILTINTFVNSFNESHGAHIDIPQFSREVPCDIGMLGKFPYRAASFVLRGTAHYHDFGRFVSEFENTFPYMRIQNIDLEPSPVTSSSNPDDAERLQFKIEVVTPVNVPN